MGFIIRPAKAEDAESIGKLAAEFIEIGKALMNRASEICLAAGGMQLFCAVYASNKDAIRFYERLGARFTQNMLFMRLDV